MHITVSQYCPSPHARIFIAAMHTARTGRGFVPPPTANPPRDVSVVAASQTSDDSNRTTDSPMLPTPSPNAPPNPNPKPNLTATDSAAAASAPKSARDCNRPTRSTPGVRREPARKRARLDNKMDATEGGGEGSGVGECWGGYGGRVRRRAIFVVGVSGPCDVWRHARCARGWTYVSWECVRACVYLHAC